MDLSLNYMLKWLREHFFSLKSVKICVYFYSKKGLKLLAWWQVERSFQRKLCYWAVQQPQCSDFFILFCFAGLNLRCKQLKNNIDLNTTHLGGPVGNFLKNPHPLAALGKTRRKKKTLKRSKIKGKNEHVVKGEGEKGGYSSYTIYRCSTAL